MNKHPQHTLSVIAPYLDRVIDYPFNAFEYRNAKEEVRARSAIGAYPLAFVVHQYKDCLECSYLLGCNNVIPDEFIKEGGELIYITRLFKVEVERSYKKHEKVKQWYDELFSLFKERDLLEALVRDIEWWSITYNFSFDYNQTISAIKDRVTLLRTSDDVFKDADKIEQKRIGGIPALCKTTHI